MNDTETVPAVITSADTKTDKPWLFRKGQPSANPNGRPRKGETLADKLARSDAKVARKAIAARDKRLQQLNMTGERAWSTYLAYNIGIPAQKHLIVTASADAAIDTLLARLTSTTDTDNV